MMCVKKKKLCDLRNDFLIVHCGSLHQLVRLSLCFCSVNICITSWIPCEETCSYEFGQAVTKAMNDMSELMTSKWQRKRHRNMPHCVFMACDIIRLVHNYD